MKETLLLKLKLKLAIQPFYITSLAERKINKLLVGIEYLLINTKGF